MRFSVTVVLTILTIAFTNHSAQATIAFNQNVTPGIIFGMGNANGSFTVDTANNVELGLRGKLRHNALGAPENTFNSNSDGTYTFNTGVAPTQAFPTAEWSIEWAINSDVSGVGGTDLADLTFALSFDSDPSAGTVFTTFDPINGNNPGAGGLVFWDHSLGDNTTTDTTDSIAASEANYATLIGDNNVAQNSWKAHWVIPGFNPNVAGEYTVKLEAFDSLGTTLLASNSIVINAVPEPSAFLFGGLICGVLGWVGHGRKRNA